VVDQPTFYFPDGSSMRTRLTSVMRQEDSAWRLLHMHVSVGVPDEEVAGLQRRWSSTWCSEGPERPQGPAHVDSPRRLVVAAHEAMARDQWVGPLHRAGAAPGARPARPVTGLRRSAPAPAACGTGG
jgi:SnoaL-like domain